MVDALYEGLGVDAKLGIDDEQASIDEALEFVSAQSADADTLRDGRYFSVERPVAPDMANGLLEAPEHLVFIGPLLDRVANLVDHGEEPAMESRIPRDVSIDDYFGTFLDLVKPRIGMDVGRDKSIAPAHKTPALKINARVAAHGVTRSGFG